MTRLSLGDVLYPVVFVLVLAAIAYGGYHFLGANQPTCPAGQTYDQVTVNLNGDEVDGCR